jgi:hypothetical protein
MNDERQDISIESVNSVVGYLTRNRKISVNLTSIDTSWINSRRLAVDRGL